MIYAESDTVYNLQHLSDKQRKMEIFDGHHRDSRDLRGETRPVMTVDRTRVAACAMCMSMWGPQIDLWDDMGCARAIFVCLDVWGAPLGSAG